MVNPFHAVYLYQVTNHLNIGFQGDFYFYFHESVTNIVHGSQACFLPDKYFCGGPRPHIHYLYQITKHLDLYFRRILFKSFSQSKLHMFMYELPILIVILFLLDQDETRNFCTRPHKHHSYKVGFQLTQ